MRFSFERLFANIQQPFHPDQCSGNLVYALSHPNSGIGSEIHSLSKNIENVWGRPFVYHHTIQCSNWSWVPDVPFKCEECSTFDCLFEKPKCNVKSAKDIVKLYNKGGASARAVRFIMKPTSAFAEWLRTEYTRLNFTFNASVISVHYRIGDKLIESSVYPVQSYIRAVTHIAKKNAIKNPVIFLSSEDHTAIKLFKAHSPYPFFYHPYKRPTFNCHSALNIYNILAKDTSMRKFHGNYSHRAKQSARGNCAIDLKKNGMISIVNLFLALESKYVLCDSSSNWCRLLTELTDGKSFDIRRQT